MNSPRRLARIAGVLYLIVAIFAGFAFSVFTGLYVTGDAATTAANVVANAGLVRMAVVAGLIQVTAWVFLTLYRLLKHVHPGAARAIDILREAGEPLLALGGQRPRLTQLRPVCCGLMHGPHTPNRP